MTRHHTTCVLFLCALLSVAGFAQERPAKHNPAYNPAAPSLFDSFNTGVVLKLKSTTIAKDGTITSRFTVTDSAGAGLDINGTLTPGPVTFSFVAAYIPNGQTQYTAYTTAALAATVNKNPSQVQASTDKNGKFVLVDAATGTYDYTFGTKAPAGFDVTATHSIGAQASRNLATYGFPTASTSDDVFTFVPNGAAVTNFRDIVNEKSCNGCHDPLSAHGGARQKVAYCILCHTPQSANPDSGITVDLKVFIHKLHRGSSLPSVKSGTPYWLQHRGARVDFSDVAFPQDIRNCTTCHAAGPKQSSNWMTNPSRAACGSCHDDVNFATGANHVNLIETDDTQCVQCHTPLMHNEFDASIPGAHTNPNASVALPGLIGKILKVDNGTAGSNPTVTFQLTDKAGNPVDLTKLTSIRMVMGGSNVDYGVNGMRVSETPTAAKGSSNGTFIYTMTNKIPATATGSYTISLEAANNVTLLAGTTQQTAATDMMQPFEFYFAVDNSVVAARRQVVSMAKCANCHQNLGIVDTAGALVHGGSRNNTQECVICHNPTLSDGTSKQSVAFAVQIHSIHRGENLTNPYVLGTTNFQEIRFPGDLRDCSTCHVNNSYQVDNVGAVAPVMSPGGFTPTTPPISAACQGCHDDKATASHALSNTSALGESCVTCHGINGEFAVDTVHKRGQ